MNQQCQIVFPARECAELQCVPHDPDPLGPNEVAGTTIGTLVSVGTEIEGAFATFVRGAGRVVACGDDPGVRAALVNDATAARSAARRSSSAWATWRATRSIISVADSRSRPSSSRSR